MSTTIPTSTGFKFRVDKSTLDGPQPFPQAVYKLRLVGFAPKNAAIKPGEKVSESVNFNPIFVMDAPGKEYDQREMKYLFNCNSKNGNWIQDMVHACGQVMEDDGSIPGMWKSTGDPKDASTWIYSGPLLNQPLEAEFCITQDNKGIPRNKIMRFICRIPQCETRFPKIRHTTAIPQR